MRYVSFYTTYATKGAALTFSIYTVKEKLLIRRYFGDYSTGAGVAYILKRQLIWSIEISFDNINFLCGLHHLIIFNRP